MLSQAEFLNIIQTNKEYEKAVSILENLNTTFSVYSCSKLVIHDLCNMYENEEYTELRKRALQIKQSNVDRVDIHDIMFPKKTPQTKAKENLEKFFKAFENPTIKERLFIIMGETGVGKSYLVEQRYPRISQYACNKGLDPYSLCYYLADKDGTGLKPYETPFLSAVRNGGKVFLDEGNELPQDTLMFIQGLTDEKKTVVIGDELVTINSGFKIIMSLNPPSETDERMPLGDALLGRAVGIVLELTDKIICDRLKVSKSWLREVKRIYTFIRSSGLVDVRDLSFRDYQRFATYDFETQLQFKACMGDVSNIQAFNKIKNTGEYENLVSAILTLKEEGDC